MITSSTNTPTIPLIFDIENDPKEMRNISTANSWIGSAVMDAVGLPYLTSVNALPNLTLPPMSSKGRLGPTRCHGDKPSCKNLG
jgi:hypothetical protein